MFTRKKKAQEQSEQSEHDIYMTSPHGGFMPFPPEYCVSTRIQTDINTNIEFVDLVICARKCSDTGYCKRYHDYRNHSKQNKTERKTNH